MWIKREIFSHIESLSTKRPVLLLTGSRQTGKTSLFRKLFPNCSFVSLDVPSLAEQAEESGKFFLESHGSPLIIDEIQYAPKLLRTIKAEVDANRQKNGAFFITGSQNFSLMKNVTESLAGRTAVLDLHTLSLSELKAWSGKKPEKTQLLQWITQGGYPEIHANDLDPQRFYSDYVATYLERDVRQILDVRSLRDFDRFMRLLAIRSGQLLSLSSFSSDLGISPNTVKSWISVLEASNIIFILEPYYQNLGKRIVKTPKLYFMDTGLACYLAGIRTPQELINSDLLGSFFETLVLGQIVKWHANRALKPHLYFYRDHYGHEIDFVLPVGEKLKLIECKWTEQPTVPAPGFLEIEKLIGPSKILSQTIICPTETERLAKDQKTWIRNCVEYDFLDAV